MKETAHVPVQMATVGTTVKVNPYYYIICNLSI